MAFSFDIYTANGATDTFSVTFGYLDPSHVFVTVDNVSATFTFPSSSQVQLDSTPSASAKVKVFRVTPRNVRQVVWQNAANLTADDLNTSDLQLLYIEQESLDLVEDALLKDNSGIFDATDIRIQNVGTPTDAADAATKAYVDASTIDIVADAEAARDDAQSARDDAETAQSEAEAAAATATTQAGLAEDAKDAVLDALDNVQWANIVAVNADSSPVTAAVGTLYVADTSAGNIQINLPALTGDASIGVQKTTGDADTVTISRGGSDTIDGGTSDVVIANGNERRTFSGDFETTNWTTAGSGLVSGNFTPDIFVDGVDYDAGVDDQLTLSVAPGSEANVAVYFGAAYQHPDQYSLSGTTLTFTETIPEGTGRIAAIIGKAVQINVPADLSVTTAKLSAALDGRIKNPTRTFISTAGSATYTTPTGCTRIIVRFQGAGGGGGARTANTGSNGGNTSFNSVVANGGLGGAPGSGAAVNNGGTGGTGTATRRFKGNSGERIYAYNSNGGASQLNVATPYVNDVGAAQNGVFGGGGQGGNSNAASGSGQGGGAGEYVELEINNPVASYSYTIGTGGPGGASGVVAGGNGGDGWIEIEEYYS